MTHPDMSKISTKESFQKELSDVEKIYREITGKEMTKFYRPHTASTVHRICLWPENWDTTHFSGALPM